MTLPLRRVLALTLALALLATACGSSGDDASGDIASSGDSASPTAEPEPLATTAPIDPATDAEDESEAQADDAQGGSTDDATSGDTDDGTAAPPAADVDPAENALGLARNLFNTDADQAAIDCIVIQAPGDPALQEALQSPAVQFGQFDDVQLKAIAYAVNGCVDPAGLGAWATEAVGPTPEIRETAPECFGARFSDEATGDATFHAFATLTLQYRMEPTARDGLVDALVTCTPVSSLTDFFVGQTESSSGFTTVVDPECLLDTIDNDAVSQEFWGGFVDGGTPPASIMAPYIESCSTTVEPEPVVPVPADFVPWTGTKALAGVTPASRANAYTAPPPMSIDPASTYTAVLATGGGEIQIRLFADSAPITVNNFVSLARDGYYDGTVFHRVLDAFMAQGGDPTGTGSGGPGYQFEDEVDGGPALDRKGLLAMANAGPGTNGSQFFITFAPTEWLTGNHTVFGEVIAGQDIVDAIELRDPQAPTGPGQMIDSITIIEG